MFLAVCAVVKNESLYIEEWLEHHILQGVEHFYIFDNESNDSTREKLLIYEKQGLVTLKKIQGTNKQRIAYDMAIKWKQIESTWVAFIDGDEFIYCPLGFSLPKMIKRYKGASIITAHQVLYGSGGQERYDPGLVTERFIYRAKEVNKHCKSICLVSALLGAGNDIHTFKTKGDVVTEKGVILKGEYASSVMPTADFFRINHYHTKSREEAFSPGHIATTSTKVAEEQFKAHDINELKDDYLAGNAFILKNRLKDRHNQWLAA